ncbi:MAG: hypothetical protein A3F09_05580 [Chlamydiae bacterium RIFCSPHIGHO2_12_FULL_49_11]|nr:MAG: hypothetical protein A3F09_05580 [Chlamydiae bacterium RIFCSPHIGHO2_12_FULL_49_11]
MKKHLGPGLFALFSCLLLVGFSYFYISLQNRILTGRIRAEALEKEIKELAILESKFAYELSHFENPAYLMQMWVRSEYMHLVQPVLSQILVFSLPDNPSLPKAKPAIQTLLGNITR